MSSVKKKYFFNLLKFSKSIDYEKKIDFYNTFM